MKTYTHIAVLIVAASALVLFGCGDDGGSKSGTTTATTGATTSTSSTDSTDGTTATDGATGTDGTDGATGTDGTDGATATTGSACTNDADQKIIDGGETGGKALSCGLGCLGQPDDASKLKCATDCVEEKSGLSAECSGCYGANVLCGLPCAGPCAGGLDSDGCKKCRCDNNCPAAYKACSGIHDSACDDL